MEMNGKSFRGGNLFIQFTKYTRQDQIHDSNEKVSFLYIGDKEV